MPLPSGAELPAADAASTPEPSWRKRVRTILRPKSVKSALVVATIVIAGPSGYVAYQYKTQKTFEAQSQNDRPVIAIVNAAIEAIDEDNLNFTLQLKNAAAKTAYSLVISVIGFDPTAQRARQLATITATSPVRHEVLFTSKASINRAAMLPVVVLCLLYADQSKRGFSEHLYYDASEDPHIDQRVELRNVSRDEHKRVDDSKVCRL